MPAEEGTVDGLILPHFRPVNNRQMAFYQWRKLLTYNDLRQCHEGSCLTMLRKSSSKLARRVSKQRMSNQGGPRRGIY